MVDYQHEDEILGKAYDGRLMKRLMRYLKPHIWMSLLAVLVAMVSTNLVLQGPLLIGRLLDEGVTPKNKDVILKTALIYLGLQIALFILSYINGYVLPWLGQKIMYDLRMEVFAHLQQMSPNFFDRNPVGRLVTRVTGDIAALGELLSSGLVIVVNDVFMIIQLMVIMLYINVKLALITMAIIPFALLVMVIFKAKLRDSYRLIRQKIARLNAYIQECVSGIRVVQVFNQEDKTADKFKVINQDHFTASYRAVKYFAVFVPSISFMGGVVIAAIMYFGGVEIGITAGVMYVFINYAIFFFSPIQDLTDKYSIFQGAMASAERIFRILDTAEEIKDPVAPKHLRICKGEITFDNVWFSYNNEVDVLKGISFTIKPGESVALVGMSGGGKTTIISLLSRFYDLKKGRILIDGIDIKDIRQSDLRRQLGIVLQDVFLFSGNILENIRLNEQSISIDRVKDVAQYVNADKFIDKLPNNYLTRVEERGSTLSAGQRQLLSFARAMVFDPKVLILDEATSAVDVETEYYIQEATSKLIKSMTSIIIAHRLSTIQNVDRILVMHKGEIKESGNHQELLAKKGIYYKLYQMQYL